MKRHFEMRDRIQTGDLLFFEGGVDYEGLGDKSSIISRLIQRWTRSSVSHVGMAWRVDLPKGAFRLMIIHSKEPNGVTAQPLSTAGHYKWLAVKTTKIQRDAMVGSAYLHWNRLKYSWWGIAVQIMKPIIGQNVAERLSREATICSRYIAWHRRRHCREDAPRAPTPAELERWAEINIHDDLRSDGSVRVINPAPPRAFLEPVKLSGHMPDPIERSRPHL